MFALRLAAIAFCAALVAPAGALGASPWQPFRASPFDLPAGSRCAFPLSGRILDDRERIRTTRTNADGTPAQQEVKGRLIVRYMNGATGESVVRDLTGAALFDIRPDGSSRITLLHGHLAVGLAATDAGGPAFPSRRTLTLGRGEVENICTTL